LSRPPARHITSNRRDEAAYTAPVRISGGPDRQRNAHVEPGRELLPGPVVDADLAAAATLAAPHQQRSAARVQLGLGSAQRFTAASLSIG
jgi:hypothetical protein